MKSIGTKNISDKDRDKMKDIIRLCERRRYTIAETMEKLEDSDYTISEQTIYQLKREMRADMKERFLAIGTEELGYEHLQALDTLKDLEKQMFKDLYAAEEPLERSKISAEIRAIRKDMAEFYSGTEIVDSVYKYMTEEQEAKKQGKVQEIRDKKK